MVKIQELFEREFEILIAKQGREGLEIADLRKLELLSRSWKAYISSPMKKSEEDDFAMYTDEVLKKILKGSTNDSTNSKPESTG